MEGVGDLRCEYDQLENWDRFNEVEGDQDCLCHFLIKITTS